MERVITSELVEAYLQCHRKAFLVLRGNPKGVQHEYEQILTERACANRIVYLDSFTTLGSSSHDLTGTFERCRNGSVEATDLRADCDAISQQTRKEEKTHVPHEPHLVVGTHSVSKEHRFRLAFAGFVIGEMRRYRPKVGLIIPVSGKPQRIRLDSLYPAVRTTIADLRKLINNESPESPPLILNENCSTCPFRQHCSQEAEEADSLCLLDRMYLKLIRKYQAKGIFTVTQLSYLFKPRRRRKRKSQPPPTFNLELQALALRTGKIYLNESPSIPENPVELFLDIEGIPDENFDYLIGLLVKDHDRTTEHCFWADSQSDEQSIFEECLDVAARYGDAPIYHYGSYEPKALLRAAKDYGIKCKSLVDRLVNVNSWIFGRVYFPSRSNRLKDLGPLVGAKWDSPDASGLQSLVWRYSWEEKRCEELKQTLIEYNRNDCHALSLLTSGLREIGRAADAREDVDFANAPKQASTELGQDIHQTFDRILLSAHAEYRRKRIRLRPTAKVDESADRGGDTTKQQLTYRRITPSKPGRTVHVRRRMKCTLRRHKGQPLQPTGESTEHTIIDLAFTKSGCRKTVTRYVGEKTHCPRCRDDFVPPAIRRFRGRSFGHSFQSWVVYQRVALRLPYDAIRDVIYNLFSEQVSAAGVVSFMEQMSKHYSWSENLLLKRILASPFVHVDETKLNIQGMQNYVWVLTNGSHVVFRLTETRESTMIQKVLAGYEGILVSDFYGGYDSVKCRQQKCLVHLIRDLNDDLWKHPYNEDLERFVAAVRDMLVPIFGDVERYGLKSRHLRKHRRTVDRFYKHAIDGQILQCEVVSTYQKRFCRYRDSLFTFLLEDGIPWNNNCAERAIRHLAVQRKISNTFWRQGAIQYLRLLGIAQTCRFQDKSFLRFLLSEEKDVDKYKEPKRPKSSQVVGRNE
jgi:predicted RecB family nuclease